MVDSAEDNKALVRRYLDTLWAQWDTPAAEAFLAPHYQRHLTPHRLPSARGVSPAPGAIPRCLCRPATHTLEDLVAEGDRGGNSRDDLWHASTASFTGLPRQAKP